MEYKRIGKKISVQSKNVDLESRQLGMSSSELTTRRLADRVKVVKPFKRKVTRNCDRETRGHVRDAFP